MNVAMQWRVLVLLGAALVAGCGDNLVNRGTVTGTWLEDTGLVKAHPGSAVVTTTGAVRRQVVFERDGTFRLTVCDAADQPVQPPESVTGQWWISGGAVALRIREVRLGPEHAGWVPETFLQMQRGTGGAPDTLDVRGRDGARVRYRRAAPSGP
jgi:hypothetical protein